MKKLIIFSLVVSLIALVVFTFDFINEANEKQQLMEQCASLAADMEMTCQREPTSQRCISERSNVMNFCRRATNH